MGFGWQSGSWRNSGDARGGMGYEYILLGYLSRPARYQRSGPARSGLNRCFSISMMIRMAAQHMHSLMTV